MVVLAHFVPDDLIKIKRHTQAEQSERLTNVRLLSPFTGKILCVKGLLRLIRVLFTCKTINVALCMSPEDLRRNEAKHTPAHAGELIHQTGRTMTLT
jgi:hypothetical protein